MTVLLWILRILGLILAAVLVLIAIVLLLPVRVAFLYSEEKGFQILYRFLWMQFGEEPDPDNPVTKAAVKVLGLDALESTENIRRAVSEQGASGTVTQIVGILMALLGRVFWLLPRARVARLHFRSVSAGSDAAEVAMDYGLVCAAIYPLLGLVKNNLRVSPRGERVEIGCDYQAEEPSLSMEIVLSVPIHRVAAALLHVIRVNVKQQLEKELENHES